MSESTQALRSFHKHEAYVVPVLSKQATGKRTLSEAVRQRRDVTLMLRLSLEPRMGKYNAFCGGLPEQAIHASKKQVQAIDSRGRIYKTPAGTSEGEGQVAGDGSPATDTDPGSDPESSTGSGK